VGARPTYALRGSFTFAQVYTIPALILKTLENLHGRDTLDRVFAAFYERWRFGHPRLEDFIAVAREVAGNGAADFLAEAYGRVALPDYRIEELRVEPWRPPRGRVVTDAGVVSPADPREGDNARAGLDPAARETAGTIVVERLDPGDAERNEPGGIERLTAVVEQGPAEPGWEREPSDAYFVSSVRIAGPGWDHLPVEIELRFADGVVLRERWDGRSPYRVYRFVRPAPLAEARVDPRGAIVLDPDVVNNGLLHRPDRSLARDWAAWIAGVALLLAEGLAQWL
jgi:hypothetical protein